MGHGTSCPRPHPARTTLRGPRRAAPGHGPYCPCSHYGVVEEQRPEPPLPTTTMPGEWRVRQLTFRRRARKPMPATVLAQHPSDCRLSPPPLPLPRRRCRPARASATGPLASAALRTGYQERNPRPPPPGAHRCHRPSDDLSMSTRSPPFPPQLSPNAPPPRPHSPPRNPPPPPRHQSLA